MPLEPPTRDALSAVPPLDAIQSPVRRELSDADLAFDRSQDELGRGGNAVVYRATVQGHGLTVALKEPFPGRTVENETIERLLGEAEDWAGVDGHPYVAGVIDWGFGKRPWIAVEYLDAGPLTDHIGTMPLAQRLWTAYAIADGVFHANKHGLYHFDLKPANVLLATTTADHWPVPKVADWGVARKLIRHDGSISQATPEYAAPEQFDAIMPDEPVDEQTEVYQLGVLCYELLTGTHPSHLHGDLTAASDIAPELPAAIDAVFQQAIATDRRDRYDFALDFKRDLADIIDATVRGPPTDEHPGSTRTPSARDQSDRTQSSVQSTPASDVDAESTVQSTPASDVDAEPSVRSQESGDVDTELTDLDRIDPADARALASIGITTVDDLAALDYGADDLRLADQLDRSPNDVARWIGEAKDAPAADDSRSSPTDDTATRSRSAYQGPFDALERVTDEEAHALESIGITDLRDLATVDDAAVARKLNRSANEIARWRSEAKSKR
jgi:serine/threonine protein kinase